MKALSYLDLVKIQSKNLDSDLLSEFYKSNNLMYHPKKSKKPFVNCSRVTDIFNTQRTIFETSYTSKKYEYFDGLITKYEHFINFTCAGTKTYKKYTDMIRNKYLDKIVDLLKINNNDYGLREFHLAFDIQMDIKKFINLLPIKLSKSPYIEDPLNPEYKTSRYIELRTRDEKVQAYIYIKDAKEGINKNIIRLEIRFKRLYRGNDISRNPYEIIKLIEKELEYYKLFYFDDIELLNIFKKQYSNNIKKKSSPNVPDKLLRELKEHGEEIELKLSDEMKKYIIHLLEKPKVKPIVLSSIVSNLLLNKQNKMYTRTIELYQIVVRVVYLRSNRAKKTVLLLTKGFIPLLESPLFLRAFPPTNKAPPIINLHLYPYQEHGYQSVTY